MPEKKTLEYYLNLKYPMEIVEDDDAFVASIPDLPGCVSYGDTLEEAVKSLTETKNLWITGRFGGEQQIPAPSEIDDFSGKFVLRIPRSLHKSLDREARQQGVSLNQYVASILAERHRVVNLEHVIDEALKRVASPALTSCRHMNYLGWGSGSTTNFILSNTDAWPDAESSSLPLQFVRMVANKQPRTFHKRLKKEDTVASYEKAAHKESY